MSFSTPFSSPTKSNASTRVIDSLHAEVDVLKAELSKTRSELDEHKKKYDSTQKELVKLEQKMDITKHHNDMNDALLTRKERRIKDLELELSTSIADLKDSKFDLQNTKTTMGNLEKRQKEIVAENERLKAQYNSLQDTSLDYKTHFEAEIKRLKLSLSGFLSSREDDLKGLSSRLDAVQEIPPLEKRDFEKVKENSKHLELMYKQKNDAMAQALKQLALAARKMGTQTMDVLRECEEVLRKERGGEENEVKTQNVPVVPPTNEQSSAKSPRTAEKVQPGAVNISKAPTKEKAKSPVVPGSTDKSAVTSPRITEQKPVESSPKKITTDRVELPKSPKETNEDIAPVESVTAVEASPKTPTLERDQKANQKSGVKEDESTENTDFELVDRQPSTKDTSVEPETRDEDESSGEPDEDESEGAKEAPQKDEPEHEASTSNTANAKPKGKGNNKRRRKKPSAKR
ncbi:unnamed protein product [Kuraishia capsulata CBS 1993]|uniref:SWI5-dependent HO expression protein 3 n=1 Tax=Kuraishia capsulata CBS 1993 TaxID=1382522 RepID=W6MJ43_9ASCO|nr:uncharacterized protein KUCA_T00000399001 [Kuraishia capsulata CBS 1993]CDK24437.1 unnamed protein product [Kuraishia capsulata CBS 1993]